MELIATLQTLAHAKGYEWGPKLEDRFVKVKRVLCCLPAISPPYWGREFYVNVSEKEEALGESIMQKDDKTHYMRLVYFASILMLGTEKNYRCKEQAIHTLMFAMKFFHLFLLPKKFTIIIKEESFYDNLISKLLEDAGIRPLVHPPNGVEVSIRQRRGKKLLFLMNHTQQPKIVDVPEGSIELLSNTRIKKTLKLGKFDVAVVLLR